MPELKPCPFCGVHDDEGEHQHADDCYFSARVRLLNAKNSDLSEVPAVLRGWNKRAIPADQALVSRELLERIAGYEDDFWLALDELRALLQRQTVQNKENDRA